MDFEFFDLTVPVRGETQVTAGLRVSSYATDSVFDSDGIPVTASSRKCVLSALQAKVAFDRGLRAINETPSPRPEPLRNADFEDRRVIVPSKETVTDSKGLSESVTKLEVTQNQQVTETPKIRVGRRRQFANAAERQRAYRARVSGRILRRGGGLIYFVQAHSKYEREGGAIKIGFTSDPDLRTRVCDLQVGNPYPLQVLGQLQRYESRRASSSQEILQVTNEWSGSKVTPLYKRSSSNTQSVICGAPLQTE
jgi:hypothetical protein